MRRIRARASLVLLLCVLAPRLAGAQALAPEAKAQFDSALARLSNPTRENLEQASVSLAAAYKQSQAWQLLVHVGFVAVELERPGEAIAAYAEYLLQGQAEIDPEERARVEHELATLRETTAWLELDIRGVSDVVELLDTRDREQSPPIKNTYALRTPTTRLGLTPGRHHLVLRGSAHAEAEFSLSLAAGSITTKTILMAARSPAVTTVTTATTATPVRSPTQPPPATTHQRSLVPFYVSGSITSVLLVGSVVTGLRALDRRSDYDAVNDGSDPLRASSLRAEASDLNLTTDVLLGVTTLGGVVTAILYQYAVAPERRHRELPRQPRKRTILGIEIGAAFGGPPTRISVSGSF